MLYLFYTVFEVQSVFYTDSTSVQTGPVSWAHSPRWPVAFTPGSAGLEHRVCEWGQGTCHGWTAGDETGGGGGNLSRALEGLI